jgi:tartrate dehydrogenase/decarboxylase/D-malate dehydrogenase
MSVTPRTHRIAVYPGDGIGREVIDEAVRVLQQVEALDGGFRLALTWFPWGAAYYREHGRVAPVDFLDQLRGQDAILLGAVGWPAELPDHVTLGPLVELRQRFDQYACVRPARLFQGLKSVLASKGSGDIDLVVVRENSEGEYVNNGGRFHVGQPDEFATQTAIHTRRGVERILHFGYQLARTRRKKLTMITKSNAMGYAYVMWDEILAEISPQYADVLTDKQHADAAVMNFVRWPETFDVVVASNLFGDILTDLGGVLGGGLGLAPSANLNPERKFPSMFEPVHGSAPDIAGKGIANPTAAIQSAAMMLEWLGETPAAARVRQAVETTIATGHRTPDLGGQLSTTQFTDHLLATLRET